MTTIKGPITIKRGDISKFAKDSGLKIALPFEATGWVSEKNMDLIPDSYKISSKPIEVSDPIVASDMKPKIRKKREASYGF